MDFVVKKGSEEHFPDVMQLIKDLAEFEKAPDSVTNTVEQMANERDFFEFFVATVDGQVVGTAVYFFAYFTWVGKSLYLDDLYVKPEYRGNKIASALVDEVFKVAKQQKCSRVRWQVLDWNTNAIEIYEKMGADLDSEWINCDFVEPAITKIASK